MGFLIIINDTKMWLVKTSNNLVRYYYLNDTTWQEGFFFDFVQKKTLDNLIRKFFIFTIYLLNERVVFDKIVKLFNDTINFLTFTKSIYSYNNVASLLATLLINIVLLIITGILIQTSCYGSIIVA